VDPADREKFIASRLDSIAHTRTEKGNVEYSFSADAVDPSCVRVFEVWESEADLAARLVALRSGQDSGPAIAVTGMDFLKYQVSSSGPLGI
jgi:hypothetical protein